MARLTVRNFSCIRYAELEPADLTLIIGPQASGKSLLCRLFYFCCDILDSISGEILSGKEFEEFQLGIGRRFVEWFPISACGNGDFSIDFQADQYHVKIDRKSSRDEEEYVSVMLSHFVKIHYMDMLDFFSGEGHKSEVGVGKGVSDRVKAVLALKIFAEKIISDALEDERYITSQVFIPAGRAFFASMRKAATAFESSESADPVIATFGHFFAFWRDGSINTKLPRNKESTAAALKLFGGEIRRSKDVGQLETVDGRIIPFALLSSGHQELLPLWAMLEYAAAMETGLFYIEEPEAHLFPSAQSVLTAYIASLVTEKAGAKRIVITTHSPYLLAKVNNLLLAGSLAERLGKSKTARLSRIIPRESWLRPGSARAYAMIDGTLTSIMDDSGLIDAAYLDQVSNDISGEFSDLLDLEPSS